MPQPADRLADAGSTEPMQRQSHSGIAHLTLVVQFDCHCMNLGMSSRGCSPVELDERLIFGEVAAVMITWAQSELWALEISEHIAIDIGAPAVGTVPTRRRTELHIVASTVAERYMHYWEASQPDK